MPNIPYDIFVSWWQLFKVSMKVPNMFSFFGRGDSSGPNPMVSMLNCCGNILHSFHYFLVFIHHCLMNVLISLLRDHFQMVQSTASKFSFHPDTCYDVTRNSTKALRSQVCLLFFFFPHSKSCSRNSCSMTLFLICYKYQFFSEVLGN